MCGSPQVTHMRKPKKTSMEAAVETEGRMTQSEVGKEDGAMWILFKCNGVTFK